MSLISISLVTFSNNAKVPFNISVLHLARSTLPLLVSPTHLPQIPYWQPFLCRISLAHRQSSTWISWAPLSAIWNFQYPYFSPPSFSPTLHCSIWERRSWNSLRCAASICLERHWRGIVWLQVQSAQSLRGTDTFPKERSYPSWRPSTYFPDHVAKVIHAGQLMVGTSIYGWVLSRYQDIIIGLFIHHAAYHISEFDNHRLDISQIRAPYVGEMRWFLDGEWCIYGGDFPMTSHCSDTVKIWNHSHEQVAFLSLLKYV